MDIYKEDRQGRSERTLRSLWEGNEKLAFPGFENMCEVIKELSKENAGKYVTRQQIETSPLKGEDWKGYFHSESTEWVTGRGNQEKDFELYNRLDFNMSFEFWENIVPEELKDRLMEIGNIMGETEPCSDEKHKSRRLEATRGMRRKTQDPPDKKIPYSGWPDCHCMIILPGSDEQKPHVDSGNPCYATVILPLTEFVLDEEGLCMSGNTFFCKKEGSRGEGGDDKGVGEYGKMTLFGGNLWHYGSKNLSKKIRCFLYFVLSDGVDDNYSQSESESDSDYEEDE